MKKTVLLGPLAFFLNYYLWTPPGLSPEGHLALSMTLWMAVWWVSEAVPMGVTALLPLVCFPLFGISNIQQTGALYGDPIIFLFLGGFMLALAIERWHLHRRVALNIVAALGSNLPRLVLGFMLATGIISMWISNTATTLMMLPIGMAIVGQIADPALSELRQRLAKALLLGIAYSSSIGGIATLIGTPTNAIMVSVVRSLYGQDIPFADWFFLILPVSMALLFLCWWYLVYVAFRLQDAKDNPRVQQTLDGLCQAKCELGPMSWEEKLVAIIFGLVALAWIGRPLIDWLIGKDLVNDTGIALFGAVVLFCIPAKNQENTTLLDWSTAVKLPWEVLILFGGGFALANAFKVTGLSAWLGSGLAGMGGWHLILILLVVVAALNFLTEVTSNVATISMMLPVLASMAQSFDVHPFLLMTGASCAASCAFMLPIATAPNALVFGAGYLNIKDMVKAGIWLNIVSIILLTGYLYLFMGLVWGIDLHKHP